MGRVTPVVPASASQVNSLCVVVVDHSLAFSAGGPSTPQTQTNQPCNRSTYLTLIQTLQPKQRSVEPSLLANPIIHILT